MRDIWRLLLSPPACGAWNMAVDEAILDFVGQEDYLPTLRLYSWDPACLSLGYSQPLADVDLPRLQKHGWDLVRRLTGGRGVLHTDELTYSIIAPTNEQRVSGTVLESYNRLAAALAEALRRLNLHVEVQEHLNPVMETVPLRTSSKTFNPVCFEVPSTYEITFGGKKLVGSAQARRKDGVLQHGSLPLTGDLARILQVLAFPNEETRNLAAGHLLDRATTIENALGQVVSWNDAAQAFISAFQSQLDLNLQTGELSLQEKERSKQLVATKYCHPDWNQKKKS
jgi:lipoate-protein ligase A